MIRDTGKLIGGIILGFIILVIVFLLIAFGMGWLQRWTADFRGETAQIEKVQADPNYRISAYDTFYNRYEAIEALEQQICNMRGVDLPDNQEDVNEIALSNQRINLIAKYEADARKEDTKANFLASDLPYEIDTEVTCS